MVENFTHLERKRKTSCLCKSNTLLIRLKVGHAGTLDPEVEGVLPIAVGQH